MSGGLSNLSKKLLKKRSLSGKPLVIIQVDTNGPDEEGGIEKIEVYLGDEPARLANEFCLRFDYDESTCQVLQQQIEDKLANAYAKLKKKIMS